jgi:hypothetical protein
MSNALNLLPAGALLKTGDVDHAALNYRPLLGIISRTRFKLVLSLLTGLPVERLLHFYTGLKLSS